MREENCPVLNEGGTEVEKGSEVAAGAGAQGALTAKVPDYDQYMQMADEKGGKGVV